MKRHYRVVARRTDDSHPGAHTLTHYAYAESVEEAVTLVRRKHEKPHGVYGNTGLYRVVKVEECDLDECQAGEEDDGCPKT